VGVILGYPGERADPLEREEASVTDVLSMAEDVTKLPTSSSDSSSPRQPPTVSDTTAAAFLRSTLYEPYHFSIRSAASADNHASTPPLKFFTGRAPFLPPNEQRLSTEGVFVSLTD